VIYSCNQELDELGTRSSANQNDPENEVLDVVRPKSNNKSLNEIFIYCRQLSGKVLRLDPNMESIRFKIELAHLLVPYKEIHKELEKEKKQTSINSYFVSSNIKH
jgi:hypothetical protein